MGTRRRLEDGRCSRNEFFRPILLGSADKGKGKAIESTAPSEVAVATSESSAKQPYELPPHDDERQVKLDVVRSFVSYPTGESLSVGPALLAS